MKKECCSCNRAITRNKICCNNHDLTGCTTELSLKSNVERQTNFPNKQNCTGRKTTIDNSARYIPQSEQTKEKNIDKYKNINPNFLIENYRKTYSGPYNDKESNVEVKAILAELYRVKAVTWGEYFISLISVMLKYNKINCFVYKN